MADIAYVAALSRDAVRSARVERLELADATHMVHLDRPERGRDRLLTSVASFLAESQRPHALKRRDCM